MQVIAMLIAVATPPGAPDADADAQRVAPGRDDRRASRARPGERRGERRGGLAEGRAASGAYRNCSEARAAGAAPVRRGNPGYGPHLDRDGDGIGCE